MRIECPYCGARGHEEFVYYGDAAPLRPGDGVPDAEQAFTDYVYLRNNPRGVHREIWFHAHGCHAWLIVERDTGNHDIRAVQTANTVLAPRAVQ